jgi:hypothetical protein
MKIMTMLPSLRTVTSYFKNKVLTLSAFVLICHTAAAQSFPAEFQLSPNGLQLQAGQSLAAGLYDRTLIRDVYIQFNQPDWWEQLEDNYESETEIPASLTIEGTTYDSVGVRFRGNTSYTMIGDSPKKSFAVATDFVFDDQHIMGYKNLKFNNAHQDASFMREVLYARLAKKYIPIAKANYIRLYLNNEYWGIYPNVQSIDKTFLEEWFLSNDGARFRATVEETGGGPMGGWGDGTAGMNYLGTDSTEYQQFYDLKSADIDAPWAHLVDACAALDDASASTIDATLAKLDVDKILWTLAAENIFTDDDSYVMKGKMDYYVYYEPETGRTTSLEYDGNSSFQSNLATNNGWGPFKNVNNANYPLLNKLITIPEWRQRYLAHYRTILQESMADAYVHPIIDTMDLQIKEIVTDDPKKLYTPTQYTNSVTGLKAFFTARRNFLLNNTEVGQVAPVIASAPYYNSQDDLYTQPSSEESVSVKATVSSTSGISKVVLYYTTGITGVFSKTTMVDDGAHNDGLADDGIYGAAIPGYSAGTLVRYYVEAIAANAALSASYLPAGAEHDVFVYTVQQVSAGNGVVINEILASNDQGQVDEFGDHDDWIEIYNNNNFDVDMSGYYLSDKADTPDKWRFEPGTSIPANGYLIVWADEEGEQGDLHANFKLSAGGETLVLSDSSLTQLDLVEFGAQTIDMAYARVPNGTGPFVIQAPTFNMSNSIIDAVDDLADSDITIYPNPCSDRVHISTTRADVTPTYVLYDLNGRPLRTGQLNSNHEELNTEGLSAGMYVLSIGNARVKLIRM